MAEESPKWDRTKWNTDPKHESERTQFDLMVEDAFNRIAERKEKENPKPKEPVNFFDSLFNRK